MRVSIVWEECAQIPTNVADGKVTAIECKAYYGGGFADGDRDFIIYSYDQLEDNWTTLPPLPVRYFGLGQVNGN